jgi:hypothetical protein
MGDIPGPHGRPQVTGTSLAEIKQTYEKPFARPVRRQDGQYDDLQMHLFDSTIGQTRIEDLRRSRQDVGIVVIQMSLEVFRGKQFGQ